MASESVFSFTAPEATEKNEEGGDAAAGYGGQRTEERGDDGEWGHLQVRWQGTRD